MAAPQKSKPNYHMASRYIIPNSTSRYISPLHRQMESKVSNRSLFTHVHTSIIHNSQKLEATQMTVNRRMDRQNVVYPYNGILFDL